MSDDEQHEARLRAMATAAIAFTDVWADGILLSDIGGKLTMTEVDALANLLYLCGATDHAHGLLEVWIEQEVEDRECDEGDYRIVPTVDGIDLLDQRVSA